MIFAVAPIGPSQGMEASLNHDWDRPKPLALWTTVADGGVQYRHGVPSESSPRRQPWGLRIERDEPRRGDRSMAHTYTNLLNHFVFSTKNREPMLDAELKNRLFPYMGGIVRELDGVALSINGPTDHVHMLVSMPARLAPAEFIGKVKASSTGWVHKTFPSLRTFAWQVGYSAFSVSYSQRERVLKYIANQEQHHRKTSFKEELIAFLRKHGIEYEERYLWD